MPMLISRMLDLFSDHTFRTVALGSAALGITSGALGTFAVLRRQSLLGDAISHAALPGVAIAKCTRPPSRSTDNGPSPLYGICTTSSFSCITSCAVEIMLVLLPLP